MNRRLDSGARRLRRDLGGSDVKPALLEDGGAGAAFRRTVELRTSVGPVDAIGSYGADSVSTIAAGSSEL